MKRKTKVVMYRLRSFAEDRESHTVDFAHEVYRDIGFLNKMCYCSTLDAVWQVFSHLKTQLLSSWRWRRLRVNAPSIKLWRGFERDILNCLDASRNWSTIALDLRVAPDDWRTVARFYHSNNGWIRFDTADRSGNLHPTFTNALRYVLRLEKDDFLYVTHIQIASAVTFIFALAAMLLGISV